MEAEKFKFRLLNRALVVIDWANVYGWFSEPKSKKYLGWKVDHKKLFDYLSRYEEIIDKRFYFGVEEGKEWSEKFKEEIESIGFNLQAKAVKWVPVSLGESHFKKVVKELFDVLDGVKITNSEIATKLYELQQKIEDRLSDVEPDFDGEGNVQGEYPSYPAKDETIYKTAYKLIEELDIELSDLNSGINELQKQMLEPVRRRKCDFDVEIARDVFNLSDTFDHFILFSGDGDYSALVEDLIINKGKKVIVVFAPWHIGKEYGKLIEKFKENKLEYRLFLCNVGWIKEFISE